MFKPKYKYYKDFRLTKDYKQRKRLVKNGWIIGGSILAILAQNPLLIGLVLALSIAFTFLSFTFLDVNS